MRLERLERAWRNHTFDVNVEWRKRKYMIEHLGVEIRSGFMNKDTDRMFTLIEWRKSVKRAERARTGARPDNLEIVQKTDDVFRVAAQIPRQVRIAMRRPYDTRPQDNDKVYLVRNGREYPGIWTNGLLHLVWIDQVGEHHFTGQTTRRRPQMTNSYVHKCGSTLKSGTNNGEPTRRKIW